MWFLDLLSNTVKVVGNTIGKAIEITGDFLHLDAVSTAGLNIQCACGFGDVHWSEKSTGEDTAKASQKLEQVKSTISPQAAEYEEVKIRACIDQITKQLHVYDTIIPNYELQKYRETFSHEIREALTGTIMKYIREKLSFGSPECEEILKMDHNSIKLERANTYQNTVVSKAVSFFNDKNKEICSEYSRKVNRIAYSELKKQELEFLQKKRLLSEMLAKSKSEQEIDIERKNALISKDKLALLKELASNHQS